MVIDSLSHLFNIFDEKEVLRFINSLSFSLKHNNILSLFTIDDKVVEKSIIDKIRPLFDGVLQIKLDEKDDETIRYVEPHLHISCRGHHAQYAHCWLRYRR